MMKVLALALVLPLTACMVGMDSPSGGGGGGGAGGGGMVGGGGGGGGSGSDMGSGSAGHITSDTTWSGAMTVSSTVTVDPNVTLTIAGGTTVDVASGAEILVLGTLDAQGTSAAKITIEPATGTTHFGSGEAGIEVGSSTQAGTLKLAYTTVTGDGIMLHGASTFTGTDVNMSKSAGDFLVVNDTASLDVSYSQIGLDAGGDTTHCDMHFNNGGTLKFTHSNVTSSYYGIMFYGGQNANFTYDNWYSNITVNVDPSAGQVTGDFSNDYFDKPFNAVAGITANNLSNAKLAACTGQNDAVCAGPRP